MSNKQEQGEDAGSVGLCFTAAYARVFGSSGFCLPLRLLRHFVKLT